MRFGARWGSDPRNTHIFEREVRDHTIPVARGNHVAVVNRIVFDLSNVTHIDNAGVEAVVGIWTAGQRKSCSRVPHPKGWDRNYFEPANTGTVSGPTHPRRSGDQDIG